MKRAGIQSLTAGLVALAAASGFAQSVTVNSAGGGNFTTLKDALWHVQNDPSGPDVITIQNVGPFAETTQLNLNGDSNNSDITIQSASPAIRPILTSTATGNAIMIQKSGNAVIRDLIILPGSAANNAARAINVDDLTTATGFNITLANLLISANNGSDQPIASLDGLTSPTFGANQRNFTGDVIASQSNVLTQLNKLYLNDVIVSGLVGGNLQAFRGFQDGAAGSEFVIGPGCVVSYCHATGTGQRAAWQPGGNDGAPFTAIAKVVGTQAKPVKFVNNGNMNGVFVTGNSTNAIKYMQWAIVANNGLRGIDAAAIVNEFVGLENVTVANNGQEAFRAGTNFTRENSTTNTILAGNGTASATNVVSVVSTNPAGILKLVNSAVVINGAYTLDTASTGGDGILESTPTNVVSTGLVTANPQFASLDPASPDFAKVTGSAYATAGPGGVPLVGGGTFGAAAAVGDWSVYN